MLLAPGVRRLFPPHDQATVIALACERPAERGRPLSRASAAEIVREAIEMGILPMISAATVQRWLAGLAIKPWHYRSWISVRDPEFAEKAGRVLDLYAGIWAGKPLGPNDFVISADEKTSIQARGRRQPIRPSIPDRVAQVESDYKRGGAVAYLAALDVFRGHVIGRIERKTGIDPFMALVDQVMCQEPYRSARRVFWIVDNGSSHRSERFAARLAARYPNAIAVHLPVHASWLNQVEIYFSILQRKALMPNDLKTTADVTTRILMFEQHHNSRGKPFKWRWTRQDMLRWLNSKFETQIKAA